jgi:hypothetical protein
VSDQVVSQPVWHRQFAIRTLTVISSTDWRFREIATIQTMQSRASEPKPKVWPP